MDGKLITEIQNLSPGKKIIFLGLACFFVLFGVANLFTYLGLLIMLIGWVMEIKKRGCRILQTPLSKHFLTLIIVSLISFINVTDVSDALSMFGTLLEIIIPYFIIFYLLKNKSNAFHGIMLFLAIIGSSIIGFYGLYEIYILKIGRIGSLVNNANILAVYILLILPLSIFLFYQGSLKTKWFIFINTIILIINFIYAMSRSGLIGLVMTIGIFGILKGKKALILFLVLALVLVIFIPTPFSNRIKNTYTKIIEGKFEHRFFIWKNALNMFKKHPLIGTGIGQYEKNYIIFEEAPIKYRRFDHAHNIFLQVMAELGILGLAVLCWIILKIIRLYILYKDPVYKYQNLLILILFSSLVGFIFQELFEFSLIDGGGITILVGVLLGWFVALVCSEKTSLSG